MASTIEADASPEKRLFISLITRDITLADALLDLIDNSINAALEPMAARLKTADDYQRLLSDSRVKPKVHINLTVNPTKIAIEDDAEGISSATAKKHVFKFGRTEADADKRDRLSVYGLGLKRAFFKCGNKVRIVSDHKVGGFDLNLDVSAWEKDRTVPWRFAISTRKPSAKDSGTKITITELYDDVVRRLKDGVFEDQLRDRIARTYAFFIGRVVSIRLNGVPVDKETFEIGSNYTSKKFKSGKVTCNITAGIAATTGEKFRDRNAGWFVFCNGRTVLYADKSSTTGWAGSGLPIFQPKHRPFLGTVFFVAVDPETLPWTTTKAAVNEESNVWQEAKRHMVAVGRVVTGFLDKRYTDDGTEIPPSDLRGASGKKVSVFAAAVAGAKTFKPPTKPAPKTLRIQYDAKVSDIKKVAEHLRRPGMGGSDVGRYTFRYFLKNEVGEDD